MTLKALCVGDIHIHTNNITQVDEFYKKLLKLINSIDIDIVILMGDVLHTHERLHTVAFNYATKLFKSISNIKPLYILVGNHDLINNSQFLSQNHWMNCFKSYNNITIVDDVIVNTINNIKITLCPYVSDGKFLQALNTKKEQWEDSRCIFAHQLFDGAKMGSIVAEGVEKWDEKSPFVVSGHIHDKQKVQSNIYYTGSSMQHAFGESIDKTILKITIDENDISMEEIDLELSKKKILYMDIDEIESFDYGSLDKNTQYKLTIHGSYEEFEAFKKTTKYKSIVKSGVKIVFKHKKSFMIEKKEQLKDKLDKPTCKSFNEILEEIVKKENNPYLEDLLNSIALNRYIDDADDIVIIDE